MDESPTDSASPLPTSSQIADRVRRIEQVIRSLLPAGEQLPRIVAVTKYFNVEVNIAAAEAGLLHFGESRSHDLAGKVVDSRLPEQVQWHFIGHLQRNKAARIAPHIAWIHSIDNIETAKRLGRSAMADGRAIQALVQVNTTGEEAKSGVAPQEAAWMMDEIASIDGLEFRGFMTMGPTSMDPEETRRAFSTLREIRDRICNGVAELSMGMSGDWPIAVGEGATMLRLGSVLFRDELPIPPV